VTINPFQPEPVQLDHESEFAGFDFEPSTPIDAGRSSPTRPRAVAPGPRISHTALPFTNEELDAFAAAGQHSDLD
jgi:hypothetical protein